MNPYVGHDSQIYGIEEHRLIGGKGDGIRLLEVNNGRGHAYHFTGQMWGHCKTAF